MTPEERIRQLAEIEALEEDPNWRAYIRFYIGLVFEESGDEVGARNAFEKAEIQFSLLDANFRDVSSEYSRCLFSLLMIEQGDPSSADSDRWISLALRAAAFLQDLRPDDHERMLVMSLAGDALNVISKRLDSRVLYRAAVDYCASAHHASSECPSVLESLVYSFYGAGLDECASRSLRMFRELRVQYDYTDRLEGFAADNLGSIETT